MASATPLNIPASAAALFQDLPKEKWWGIIEYVQFEGFWYSAPRLQASLTARSNFEALDDDVILASCPKTGTTWLKALIPSIMNRTGEFKDDDSDDPLLKNHPNAFMPSLEMKIFRDTPNPDLSDMVSPRLFRTHVPYTMLSESAQKSDCKIVYITRDPKDAFVSFWHFMNTNVPPSLGKLPIDAAFESFCKGVYPFGPLQDHALGYFQESQMRPEKILFLKYEELKEDPKGQLKKLASFLGKPFVNEEEVDKILWRCSLERLKSLEVNQNGVDPWDGLAYKTYFRLGNVGDWKNSLTPEMKDRLDEITLKKLEGSDLVFGSS
ncbi:cytosolic sulfotransferase 7-like [Pistacia vera]|uniref:cytosolic sulfotransferase 7-like n=1 Tax=Pistacia vera TaxID=55513 RepID=UPI0012635F0F|nr:cytosolic sulfotransferase 7-like [Pistacia vera]